MTESATKPTIDGIDLLAATWGRGVPHDQFDRMREEAPVCWHPEENDTGFWALTKHADVKAVSHDSATTTYTTPGRARRISRRRRVPAIPRYANNTLPGSATRDSSSYTLNEMPSAAAAAA